MPPIYCSVRAFHSKGFTHARAHARTDFPPLDRLGVEPKGHVDEARDDGAGEDLHGSERREREEAGEGPAVDGPGDVAEEKRRQQEVVHDPGGGVLCVYVERGDLF